MDVTLTIPDEIADHLLAGGEDLRRRALESLALAELRAGRISEAQLAQMLGLDRMEVDGFLKAHGVYYDFTVEEIEEQVNTLKRLGL